MNEQQRMVARYLRMARASAHVTLPGGTPNPDGFDPSDVVPSVRVRDLMGDPMVDRSAAIPESDTYDGCVSIGDARFLKVTPAWQGSRVKHGERPRAGNARSNHDRDSFGLTADDKAAKVWRAASARKRKGLTPPTTAEQRLTAMLAGRHTYAPEPRGMDVAVVTPTLAHSMMAGMSCPSCGRFDLPSSSPSDLVCRCTQVTERATYDADSERWTHYSWTDETWLPLDCRDDCSATEHHNADPIVAVESNVDKNAPVPMGYNVHAEQRANAFLVANGVTLSKAGYIVDVDATA